MPYKDPEKRREATRESMAKRREEKKAMDAVIDGMGDHLTIEDVQAVYGNAAQEEALLNKARKVYERGQTWAFVFYPDSAPQDWEEQLRMIGVSFAVSPLHDKDVTADGRPKKPHWHAMLHWPHGQTTYRTAEKITRGVLHGTIPIALVSPRGYYRYFCHLDNPNKAQYDERDIITGNGFDIGDFLDLTAAERNALAKEILEECIAHGFTEYWELVYHAMYCMSGAAFEFIRTNTTFLNAALKSKKFMEMAARNQ